MRRGPPKCDREAQRLTVTPPPSYTAGMLAPGACCWWTCATTGTAAHSISCGRRTASRRPRKMWLS